MAFKVPESKRSIAQNRFEFELPDGQTYSVPKAKYLTIGQVEKLSELGDDLNMADLLTLFDEPEAAAAARTLDVEQLEALMLAWQEDSGLSVGESSASAQTS
jgi:hypothetical protein